MTESQARDAASRCLCAERDLLGDDEPCAGFGSISDELCEQAERESIAAGTWPPEPPAAKGRVCLTERECRQWIDTLRRPPWDVRRKRTIERVADELERAVNAALECNLVLRGYGD